MSNTITSPETHLNILLKGPLAAHVDKKIASSQYDSHSDYVRDLIRRDMYRDDTYDLREGIIEGYADIAEGRYTDYISHEELFEKAVQELREEGYDVSEHG